MYDDDGYFQHTCSVSFAGPGLTRHTKRITYIIPAGVHWFTVKFWSHSRPDSPCTRTGQNDLSQTLNTAE